ncbi:MAG: hypothetical protein QXX08_00720 [Candidatus Bathyarchaeia archaeon]
MKPLSLIYIIKICLGILTAIICVLLNVDLIFTGIAIGILVYWVFDKILKQIFIGKVEKPSVITKTGIGVYIITWIFFWALLFTFRLYLTSSLP